MSDPLGGEGTATRTHTRTPLEMEIKAGNTQFVEHGVTLTLGFITQNERLLKKQILHNSPQNQRREGPALAFRSWTETSVRRVMKDFQIQTPLVCVPPANCPADTCRQFGKVWEDCPLCGRAPSCQAFLAQASEAGRQGCGAGRGQSPRPQPLGLASCWK
ncbi:Zinc Finger Cchc Domain-Containing Protein 9 [Manis pentadactyla]|nr:Zinc Finger Cchc Domain-Containing Protein 9 [Manis pentadactyla]